MEKYDLYLFDFDETLLHTLPSLYDVFIKSFKDLGYECPKENCLRFARIPLKDGFVEITKDETRYLEYVSRIRVHLDEIESIKKIELFNDSLSFWNKAKENKMYCGVVTSNTAKHVIDVLNVLGLDNIFSVIVGCDDVKQTKPSPEPILCALEKIHYIGDMKKVCYVGDALNDAKSAINAFVTPILIDRNNEYERSGDYIYIKTLNDLFD